MHRFKIIMTEQEKTKIEIYLKAQPKKWGHHGGKILCFDQIDNKRVDIDFTIDGELFIGGDDGEVYELDELKLLDERVLNF